MNGIIIDGKVYEAGPSGGYSNCDGCDLTEVCDAHAHDICNDCSTIFDTSIDDPCWHFRFSQELTDKINNVNPKRDDNTTDIPGIL